MGVVYRAVQVSLNRRVALKVMVSHHLEREDLVARFRREAMAAAALNHPNVVQIYDFGEAPGGVCYYVMELVDGLSFGDYLGRGEAFSEREVIEVGREVTLALRAAHRAGIVHRDIKPDNLMLNSEGSVKLADLGLARVCDLDSDVSLTVTGMSVGTPLYMAPEQAQGEKTVDHRADFYSLGATLFHLATGRPPFDGETAGAILAKQLREAPPDARAFNASLGSGFAELMGWMMAMRQADRPDTHAEILDALDRCHCDAIRRESGGAEGASRIVPRAMAPVPWARVFLKRPKMSAPIWTISGCVFAAIAITGWLTARTAGQPKLAEGTHVAAGVPREQTAEGGYADHRPGDAGAAGGPVESGPGAATALATASKDTPFVNSLGMRFVAVPATGVLFSIWETRVRDFEAFVRASGHAWDERPPFEQEPEHPAVMVSWEDAVAFCAWLSRKEGLKYRLPSDDEWDAAVGSGEFPWGDEWPPPPGAANLAGGESAFAVAGKSRDQQAVVGYRDGYPFTAPVGSGEPNGAGLYDLAGNVWEYCNDWYTEAVFRKHWDGGRGFQPRENDMAGMRKGDVWKVLRGGAWNTAAPIIVRSRNRYRQPPGFRDHFTGFRCVIAVPSSQGR
jgi:formylglycine-generating enzyme required for sulfatase activity